MQCNYSNKLKKPTIVTLLSDIQYSKHLANAYCKHNVCDNQICIVISVSNKFHGDKALQI